MRGLASVAWACLAIALVWAPAGSRAQAYDTLAARPDPHDFMSRDETRLILLGNTVRFMGYDLGWLGLRVDGPPVSLSAYELADATATARALGGTVVRARPVGFVMAGTPARMQPDPAGLAELDLMIATARDMGLKLIVPLAGSGGDCAAMPAEAACSLPRAHGATQAGAFFADAGVRRDFLAGVAAVLAHVNARTGAAYQDDPAIMAWENCLQCGGQADAGAVSAWVEEVGRAIKAADRNHLYENGAFGGHLEPSSGHAVAAGLFATPSVDIVGEVLDTTADPATARSRLTASSAAVADSGRVFVLDSTPWAPSVWKTVDDMNDWIFALSHDRGVSGLVAGRLVGHADGGGFLPPPPADPAHGVAALYFPGIPTRDMDADRMTERGRGLRRLAYAVADITDAPAYLLPPRPTIVSAAHAHIIWLGAAGAARYSIERSSDPTSPNTWQLVCDACTTDLGGGWQDPSPASPPAWYRIIPGNINGHRSVPSDPVQATK